MASCYLKRTEYSGEQLGSAFSVQCRCVRAASCWTEVGIAVYSLSSGSLGDLLVCKVRSGALNALLKLWIPYAPDLGGAVYVADHHARLGACSHLGVNPCSFGMRLYAMHPKRRRWQFLVYIRPHMPGRFWFEPDVPNHQYQYWKMCVDGDLLTILRNSRHFPGLDCCAIGACSGRLGIKNPKALVGSHQPGELDYPRAKTYRRAEFLEEAGRGADAEANKEYSFCRGW